MLSRKSRRPAEQPAWVDTACGGDAELRDAVWRLLRAHGNAGTFLETRRAVELALPAAACPHQ